MLCQIERLNFQEFDRICTYTSGSLASVTKAGATLVEISTSGTAPMTAEKRVAVAHRTGARCDTTPTKQRSETLNCFTFMKQRFMRID